MGDISTPRHIHDDRHPYILLGHNFCAYCLSQWRRSGSGLSHLCPLCQGSKPAQIIYINHAVREIATAVQTADPSLRRPWHELSQMDRESVLLDTELPLFVGPIDEVEVQMGQLIASLQSKLYSSRNEPDSDLTPQSPLNLGLRTLDQTISTTIITTTNVRRNCPNSHTNDQAEANVATQLTTDTERPATISTDATANDPPTLGALPLTCEHIPSQSFCVDSCDFEKSNDLSLNDQDLNESNDPLTHLEDQQVEEDILRYKYIK